MSDNQTLVVDQLVLNLEVYKSVFIHTYTNQLDEKKEPVASDIESDFLGKQELENGFPNVYVSWTNTDKWSPNCGGLFRSPKSLGMESITDSLNIPHIALEELCWVLEPIELCEKIYDMKWTDFKSSYYYSKNNFEDQVKIANYYHASIQVFSAAINDRNDNTILILEHFFPYITLVGIVSNELLPFKIRTAFVVLLRRLWLERYPSEENCGLQSLPDTVWVYETISKLSLDDKHCFPKFSVHEKSSLKTQKDPFYSLDDSNKYHALIIFVEKFLSEFKSTMHADMMAENVFITEVMHLISQLVSFGFYSSTPMLEALLKKLLPLLDGRKDEKNDTKEAEIKDIARYKRDTHNVLVMEAKISILNVIKQIQKLRQHYRLSELMNNFKQWNELMTNPEYSALEIKELVKLFTHFEVCKSLLEIFDINPKQIN